MNYDTHNEMFQLAIQLVNQSNRNIFLTGKAGTGKTTFLKYIRENCPKQMAVVAPTGVAAINAGGVTIHSFFNYHLLLLFQKQREQDFRIMARTLRQAQHFPINTVFLVVYVSTAIRKSFTTIRNIGD